VRRALAGIFSRTTRLIHSSVEFPVIPAYAGMTGLAGKPGLPRPAPEGRAGRP